MVIGTIAMQSLLSWPGLSFKALAQQPTETKIQSCLQITSLQLFPTGLHPYQVARQVLAQGRRKGWNGAQIIYGITYETHRFSLQSQWKGSPKKYGHHKTTEVLRSQLTTLVQEGFQGRDEYLAPEALQAWSRMQKAALLDGIRLAIADSHRTYAEQDTLFQTQVSRRGNEASAAKWSAPPGHSEHHTGFALDISGADQGKLLNPQTDPAILNWLNHNAWKYGWEMSFRQTHHSGIQAEPWHWRYVSPRSRPLLGLPPAYVVNLEPLTPALSAMSQPSSYSQADKILNRSLDKGVANPAARYYTIFNRCLWGR